MKKLICLVILITIIYGCKSINKNEGRGIKDIQYKDFDDKLPEFNPDDTAYLKNDVPPENCTINNNKDNE